MSHSVDNIDGRFSDTIQLISGGTTSNPPLAFADSSGSGWSYNNGGIEASISGVKRHRIDSTTDTFDNVIAVTNPGDVTTPAVSIATTAETKIYGTLTPGSTGVLNGIDSTVIGYGATPNLYLTDGSGTLVTGELALVGLTGTNRIRSVNGPLILEGTDVVYLNTPLRFQTTLGVEFDDSIAVGAGTTVLNYYRDEIMTPTVFREGTTDDFFIGVPTWELHFTRVGDQVLIGWKNIGAVVEIGVPTAAQLSLLVPTDMRPLLFSHFFTLQTFVSGGIGYALSTMEITTTGFINIFSTVNNTTFDTTDQGGGTSRTVQFLSGGGNYCRC